MPTPNPRRTNGTNTQEDHGSLKPADPCLNVAILAGTLIADPVISELSSGKIVASLSIRTFDATGKRVSSPVRWLEPGTAVHRFHSDQKVVVIGQVVRRFFRAGGQVISRTEVDAHHVFRPTQKVTQAKALARAAAAVTDFVDNC